MKSFILTSFLITFFVLNCQAASIFCIGSNQWKLISVNTSIIGNGSCDISKISDRFACVGTTFYNFTSDSSYSSSSPVNCEKAVITEQYACVGKALVVATETGYTTQSPVDCSKY
jgi:hypothetical protein